MIKNSNIIGSGIDIIEIPRVKNAIDRWDGKFLNRVFTEKEIKYSKKKKFSYQHFAARFAAKEAILKALGVEKNRFNLKDIEILNNELGRPKVVLQKRKSFQKEKIDIFLSISHTKEYAVASAIVYSTDKK